MHDHARHPQAWRIDDNVQDDGHVPVRCRYRNEFLTFIDSATAAIPGLPLAPAAPVQRQPQPPDPHREQDWLETSQCGILSRPARSRSDSDRVGAGSPAPGYGVRRERLVPELSTAHHPLYQLRRTPFHARTSALCLPHNWRRWGGCIAVGSYDLGLEREYWAIRNHAALIDISPLVKYEIAGRDAARLLHRLTPRDVHKMQVGQVYYTGWCDDDGKLLDDGTVTRTGEQSFRLTAAEPQYRWLSMNAVGMEV